MLEVQENTKTWYETDIISTFKQTERNMNSNYKGINLLNAEYKCTQR